MTLEVPNFSPNAPKAYRLAMGVALALDGMPVAEAANQCEVTRSQLYHVLGKEPAWQDRRPRKTWKPPEAFAQGVLALLADAQRPLTLNEIHEAFPHLSLRTMRSYIAQMNASGRLLREETVTYRSPPTPSRSEQ